MTSRDNVIQIPCESHEAANKELDAEFDALVDDKEPWDSEYPPPTSPQRVIVVDDDNEEGSAPAASGSSGGEGDVISSPSMGGANEDGAILSNEIEHHRLPRFVEIDDAQCRLPSEGFRCCSNECPKKFSPEAIRTWIFKWRGASKSTQDAFILGVLAATVKLIDRTGAESKLRKTSRSQRSQLVFLGTEVCRKFYCVMHDLGESFGGRMSRIRRFLEALLEPEVDLDMEQILSHKAKDRIPNNVVANYERTKIVIDFLNNYADYHGLPDPGKNFKDNRRAGKFQVLLPSEHTLTRVFHSYKEAASKEHGESQTLKYSTFRSLWKSLCPHIVILSARTDLCHVCTIFRSKLMAARQSSSSETILIEQWMEHKDLSRRERGYYKGNVWKARESAFVHGRDATLESISRPPLKPVVDMLMISFDYAQQILLPTYPDQVGQLYFLAGRKVQIFGITDEGTRSQHTYLVDETFSVGKGSSAVISMVDHFLLNFPYKIEKLCLSCDNCGGQNKNKYLMSYCAWLVACKGFGVRQVDVDFMQPGHTKFSPDGFFGKFKMKVKSLGAGSIY